jgi:hypothetical protein
MVIDKSIPLNNGRIEKMVLQIKKGERAVLFCSKKTAEI